MFTGFLKPIAIVAGLCGLMLVIYAAGCDGWTALSKVAPTRVNCSRCGADLVADADAPLVWCDVCRQYVTPKR